MRRLSLPVLMTAGLLSACSKRPTTAQCEAMLDHGVELAIRDKRPDAGDVEIASERARRRRQAPGRMVIETCPKEVSAKALDCALGAGNLDEYERCLVVTPWDWLRL